MPPIIGGTQPTSHGVECLYVFKPFSTPPHFSPDAPHGNGCPVESDPPADRQPAIPAFARAYRTSALSPVARSRFATGSGRGDPEFGAHVVSRGGRYGRRESARIAADRGDGDGAALQLC